MEIRATKKDFKRFKRIQIKSKIESQLPVTLDENLNVSIIMVAIANTTSGIDREVSASLQEWTRGRKNIESFLKYGYVRIIKDCPYRLGKCVGEKCSLYHVKNGTGDCSHIWGIV